MEDCYARLLRMVAEGKSDADIAHATGWPQDACAMIREELQCADDVFVEEEVA